MKLSQRFIWALVVSLHLPDMAISQDTALVYEDFELALHNPLEWSDLSGSGWLSAWERSVGDDVVIDTGQITHPGFSTVEGNHHLVAHQQLVGLRFQRSFPLIPDDGRAIWLSCLLDFKDVSHPNGVTNIALLRSGNQEIAMGKKFGNEKIGFAMPEAGNYNTDIDARGARWLVMKLQFSGDREAEQAWLWVDPDPSAEPNPDDADLAAPQDGLGAPSINSGVNGIEVRAEGTAPQLVLVDEIKIGRSYESVSSGVLTTTREVHEVLRLEIYPNPVARDIFIRSEHDLMEESARLMTSTGEIISVQLRKESNHIWQLSPGASLTPGHYIFFVSSQDGRKCLARVQISN